MSDFDKIAEKWAGLILDSGADDPVEGIKMAMEEAAESLEQQLTEEKKKNEELVRFKQLYEWIEENATYLGGGDGGTYSFKVTFDSECMGDGITKTMKSTK